MPSSEPGRRTRARRPDVAAKTARFGFVVLILVFGLPGLLGQLSWHFSTILTPLTKTYIDEAGVTESTMTIYEHGYRGYRCREGQPNYCYGPAQAFLDALTLKACSSDWLKGEETLAAPGAHWPFLLRYPRVGEVLRFNRFVAAFGILILMGLLGLRAGGGAIAIAVTLALANSPAFQAAWQGIGLKNDHYSVFFGLIFFMAAHAAFKTRRPSARFAVMVAASLLGLWAWLIRAALIVPYGMALATYVLIELASRTRPGKLGARLVALALVQVAAYVALNPNLFVSGFEARWFVGFFTHTGDPGLWRQLPEELRLAAECLWPTLLFLATAGGVLRESPRSSPATRSTPSARSNRTVDWLRWGYYAVTIAVFSGLVIKASHVWAQYYLPSVVLAFFGMVMALAELRSRQRRQSLELLILAATAAVIVAPSFAGGSPFQALAGHWRGSAEWPHVLEEPELDRALNEDPSARAPHWLVDTLLRAPLRRSGIPWDHIRFFDSLSDPPAEVLARPGDARPRAHDDPNDDNNEQVLVACWDAPLATGQTPQGRQWATLLRGLCGKARPVNDQVFELYFQTYTPDAVRVSAAELRARLTRLPKLAPLAPGPLDPIMLVGGPFIEQHFEFPRYVTEPATLTGSFAPTRALRRVSIPIRSSCRRSGSVTLKAGLRVGSVSSGPVSIATEPALCADHPLLCRSNAYQSWSQHYYETSQPVAVNVNVPAGAPLTLTLEIEVPHDESCRVILGRFAVE